MLNFDSRIVQLYGACILEGCPVVVLEFMGVCCLCPSHPPRAIPRPCMIPVLLAGHCIPKLSTSAQTVCSPCYLGG